MPRIKDSFLFLFFISIFPFVPLTGVPWSAGLEMVFTL